MQTVLSAPQGQFKLRRWPLAHHETLQAWDAADEYLLNHLAENPPGQQQKIVLLNDSFGTLATVLHSYALTAITDSYLSQLATRHNFQQNHINDENIRLLNCFDSPSSPIDYLLIKVPKTLALLEYQLLSLRPLLTQHTKIIAAGMVKNLPSSVWSLFERILGPVRTSLAVKKARLLFINFTRIDPPPKNPFPISYCLENTDITLINHANVFSRDSLDIGSRFFLQYLPENPAYVDFIDLGCGNGVLGLCLAKQIPIAKLSFVDESFMAIASARHNFSTTFATRPANFIIDDCLSSFASASADCIVCNPPFHQQHAIGSQIAQRMFLQAKQVLRHGGELRIIGNRHLDYHIHLKKLFGSCHTIASNAKFVILQAIKH